MACFVCICKYTLVTFSLKVQARSVTRYILADNSSVLADTKNKHFGAHSADVLCKHDSAVNGRGSKVDPTNNSSKLDRALLQFYLLLHINFSLGGIN